MLDLARMDPATVRSRWSVVLERTVLELQGVPCIGLDDEPLPKKEIASTRSFGRPITDLAPLTEAVSEFVGRAAEKLRKQSGLASQVLVFAHTSPHRPGPRFNRSITLPLRRPTADTALLAQAALAGIRRIYEPGYQLIKAGVMLLDLVPDHVQQGELNLDQDTGSDRSSLMSTLDALNFRYGKGTLHLASTGTPGESRQWGMRQERRTPNYTTNFMEIPVARA